MLRDAVIVFRKELRDVLRDRRTLMFMVLVPMLLVPLLGGLVTGFMSDAAEKASSKTLQFAVEGAEVEPDVVDALMAAPGMQRVDLPPDPQDPETLRGDALDFVVSMSEGSDGAVIVELHYDNAPMMTAVKKRVEAVVEQVSDERRDHRLNDLGLHSDSARAATLQPVQLVPRGIASKRELLGEQLGGMVPYLFIIFCFLGAMYPAIDLAAGEKERGTMETMLLAPISRTALVMGKFGVVMSTALVSTGLGTASLGVWLMLEGQEQSGPLGAVLSSIGPAELGLIGLMFVPIAAIFATGLLSLSIFAKSFKEAQSYLGTLNVFVFLPAMVGMLPGIELDARWAMVPVANVALAIKEIVKGTIDPLMLVLIFGSSTALAAALLAFGIRMFSRESVLFRS